MEQRSAIIENILQERFGKDTVISLATAADGKPYVRSVNAFYDDGSFYVLTYLLSSKMQQIKQNSNVAISGEWFTASGQGINLGYWGSLENAGIAQKMKAVFAQWIDNGHNNFDDPNTIILQIRLENGVLFSHGTRYDIQFSAQNRIYEGMKNAEI